MSYPQRGYPTRGGVSRPAQPYEYPGYGHSPTYPPQQSPSAYSNRSGYNGYYGYASHQASPTHPYPPPVHSPYRQNTYPPAPSPGYFPPPPHVASPYAAPPPSASNYSRQTYPAGYERDYARPTNHAGRYSPTIDRRHSGSSSTGHHTSSQKTRGRGTFTNLSWTPSTGNRGGVQQPPKNRREIPSDRQGEQDDEDDNPFRPSKDLQSEDLSVKEAKEQSSKASSMAPANSPPIEPQNDNKVKFALKSKPPPVRTTPSADLTQSKRDIFSSRSKPSYDHRAEHSDYRNSKYDSRDDHRYSDHRRDDYRRDDHRRDDYRYDDRRDHRSSRYDDTRESRRYKGVKRLKPKPTLPDDLAASDSVYFRKPGSESVVGSGTYGKVYKAVHVYTNSRVALKRIRMDGERDGFPVTAIREVKLLQSLHSSHIVRLLEVMVERNDCYMVFEYLSHDLTGLLNHPSFTLTPAHKKHLALQLFQGLDYLHDRGVLHRDIKAANILVSTTGQLKLADFGLARFYAKRRQLDYTNRVITIWYRSPELLLGETQYGPAVDIWSAACVLVEIFTRHAVFPGDGGEINQLDRIYAVLGTPTRAEWPSITDLAWFELLRPTERKVSSFAEKYRHQVTPAAFELLSSMFAFDPAKRPSAQQVLEHPYFNAEEPAPRQVLELEGLEGEWHEFESKALRKEKERQERESRKEKEREEKERKRSATNGDAGHEVKRIKLDAEAALLDGESEDAGAGAGAGEAVEDDGDGDADGLLEISAIE
ncbi:MAG: kinase subunit of RNA polymerase II carboxy-terminal domain kinase I [Chrysothrix sp. TS-e1954]|nr:MAG: kinase subunit of RNA polymerase II carboxy-terminal domain kinase I [Chrysothrix sp. TS-e1954]